MGVPMRKSTCMDHALSVADAFRDNYPRCRSCLGLARPSVAGGGDLHWVAAGQREERYCRWRRALKQLVIEQPETRVVILEIGAVYSCDSICGRAATELSWTTVRQESEAVLRDLNSLAVDAAAGEHPRPATLI